MTSEIVMGPFAEERLFHIALWLQLSLAGEGLKSLRAALGFVSKTSLEQKWNSEEVPIDQVIAWIQERVESEGTSLGEFDLHLEIPPEQALIHFDHHGCLRICASEPKRLEMLSNAVIDAELALVGHARIDLRSLAMHRAIAEKLKRTPTLIEIAFDNLLRWSQNDGRWEPYMNKWKQLLDGPFDELLASMVEDSESMRAMRQASPFAGILSPKERWKIYDDFSIRDRVKRS